MGTFLLDNQFMQPVPSPSVSNDPIHKLPIADIGCRAVRVPGEDARQGGLPGPALRPARGGDHAARGGRGQVTVGQFEGLSLSSSGRVYILGINAKKPPTCIFLANILATFNQVLHDKRTY